jgi:hypothetical protein
VNEIKTWKAAFYAGGAVFALSVVVLGCLNASGQPAQVSQRYTKSEDLQPYAVPYEDAYVIFGGHPVETTVSAQRSEGNIELQFICFDRALDEERYSFDDTAFRYVGSVEDTFEPGIPLLRFPLEVGDEWTWAGTNQFGGQERAATADVTTSQDRLNTVAGEYGTVKVAVQLSIESGSAKPVSRLLTFWFAPKRGVVRREFEWSTTREPMPPKESASR